MFEKLRQCLALHCRWTAHRENESVREGIVTVPVAAVIVHDESSLSHSAVDEK